MGRWRREAFNELEGLAADTAKRRDVAAAAQRKTLINEEVRMALEHATAPDGIFDSHDILSVPDFDDGLPPSLAKNVTVTPIMEGLVVSWDTPNVWDKVRKAEIQLTPGGVIRAADISGHTFLGLNPHTQYGVRVNLTDAFGESSGWTPQKLATPFATALEEIDLTAFSILGRLKGLLPNANLATIQDATKLGDDVILARAMATQDFVAINTWMQNAAILSAKIASLAADKIVGGTIFTTQIFIASAMRLAGSGQITAGGTFFDAGGVSMLPEDTYRDAATFRDRKIGPTGDWAAVSFFDQGGTGINIRGASIRSDGDAGVRKGAIILHATKNGNVASDTSARIELIAANSGPGGINIFQDLWVRQTIDAQEFKLRQGGSLSGAIATANSALSKANNAIHWNEVVVRKADGVLVKKGAGGTAV